MKTKTALIFFVILFSVMAPAGAQQGKFLIGAKAGFGIPNLTSGSVTTPLSEGYTSRLGFYGGLISELYTGTHFGFRTELNFSSQGGQRDGIQALPLPPELAPFWEYLPAFGIIPDGYMYADIRSEAILNYLELPVMAKYRFKLGSKVNFYLQAGPYIGFLINAKNITSGSSPVFVDDAGMISVDDILEQAKQPPVGPQSFDHTENITSDVHRFNFGGQVGAGFELMMKSGEFFIEGGGNYGFLPIQKDEANGTNNTGAGTLTVGYLFFL
jgi:hypothetical protein